MVQNATEMSPGDQFEVLLPAPSFKHHVGLEMGLSVFQIRPVSGPEIASVEGLNDPNRFKRHPKWWGASRPNILDGF